VCVCVCPHGKDDEVFGAAVALKSAHSLQPEKEARSPALRTGVTHTHAHTTDHAQRSNKNVDAVGIKSLGKRGEREGWWVERQGI
jgi:hypothetical protein